jgi:hypothetical protein
MTSNHKRFTTVGLNNARDIGFFDTKKLSGFIVKERWWFY